MLKLALVMFYDEKIKSYGDINAEINKKYCEKHNIDFIVSNKHFLKDRYPSWERLPLILQNLDNYDYVIYIDSDAFFYYNDRNIKDLILENKNYDIIFSQDNDYGEKQIRKKKYKMDSINAGVLIFKNTNYSKLFICKWLNDIDYFKKNKWKGLWEQGVLWSLYNDNILDIRKKSIILPYGTIQNFRKNDYNEKSYIFHLAGTTEKSRVNTSKKYLNSLNN